MKKIMAFAATVFILGSCNQKRDYSQVFSNPGLFSNTVFQLNTVVMGNNFTPMVASRNYVYASVAAYEVIAAGYPSRFKSLAGQVRGLNSVPSPQQGQMINYDFASLLAFCKLGESVTFPEGSMKDYVDSLKRLAKDHGMPDEMFANSVSYADEVSKSIMDWSRHDQYSETRGAPQYTVNDSPGRWVPTPPAYSPAAEPHWNEIREMVLDSINEFLPPPPFAFNVSDKNSAYYKEVKFIESKGDSLSKEEAFIADFWDDNPFKLNVSGHLMFGTKKFSPGGHWMGIAGIASKKAGSDFPTTVYAATKTAIALFDAFIQCWNIKYRYNTVRPETVVNKYFDPNWRPHLQTPPFPEYTCGHCYISAAAAEALTSVYGDHFNYTDTTEVEFGIPQRSYKSFYDAADEVRYSRFYGGIHYHYSIMESSKVGHQIGSLIAMRLKMKKD
ncbi:MAG TPA: vanadium-dependent haloperoxidase [Puia sp.]|nr:vanadium-dependent haloperoxidase [Puia sp.]